MGRKGGGDVELVKRSKGAWLEKDYGFEHTLFGAETLYRFRKKYRNKFGLVIKSVLVLLEAQYMC